MPAYSVSLVDERWRFISHLWPKSPTNVDNPCAYLVSESLSADVSTKRNSVDEDSDDSWQVIEPFTVLSSRPASYRESRAVTCSLGLIEDSKNFRFIFFDA